METVLLRPTTEEYHERMKVFAERYSCESWLLLSQDKMSREDRFEYSFIMSAVGDELIQREFSSFSQFPTHSTPIEDELSESGAYPGSLIYELVG